MQSAISSNRNTRNIQTKPSKKRKVMIYILIPLLLLVAFVLVSQWRAHTPSILGSDGQPLPNSIASLEKVNWAAWING